MKKIACSYHNTMVNMDSSSKLVWILAMHRHGERSPLNMAPKDKYNDLSYWPEGFGNLTNAGRLRMYKLGKYIRRRYSHFLTDNFRDAYSRSSDVDRCIESSQAVLAGVYPPKDRLIWNENLLWTPTPVHSVPASDDYILNESGRETIQSFIEEIAKIEKSDLVKELFRRSEKEREILTREYGYEFDSFVKFKCVFSTFDIEKRSGLDLPSWYTKEMETKMYLLSGKAFALAGGGTERMKQIRSGYILDDLTRRMELVKAVCPVQDRSEFHQPVNEPSSTDSRRFVHYSTHDSIISAFIEALNLHQESPVPPGFGATFFIELYVDTALPQDEAYLPDNKYIKLYYLDVTESEKPEEQFLPGCPLNSKGRLTLTTFKEYVKHLLPMSSS